MELHQAQIQIVKEANNYKYRVVNAGRQFGKSTLLAEEIKGKAFGKSSDIIYIAPTYQQARDIMWLVLIKELRPIILDKNESRLEIITKALDPITKTWKGGTSRIVLRGWESVETIRGQQFDFMGIDEIAMMKNFFLNWHEVLEATLARRQGRAIFISTPKGYNHFYDLYNKELNDPDYKSFHFTTYDNPFISKEWLEKTKLSVPEDAFAQEYMAEFRKRTGLVYPEFSRDTHISSDLPRFKNILCGLDFGYTNPTAILVVGVDQDNRYWIIDESYKTQQTKEQTIAILKGFQPNYVYADPEDAEGIAKLKEARLNVMEVNKNKIDGINKVREFLLQNRLKVHPKCINFINEIEAYAYKENRDGKNTQEEPEKLNDHLMDALKYIVFNHKINEFAWKDQLRVNENRRSVTTFE